MQKPQKPSAAKNRLEPALVAKCIILVIFLISSTGFLGIICQQITGNYQTYLSSQFVSQGILSLTAIFLVIIFSGLVATLIRPFWPWSST